MSQEERPTAPEHSPAPAKSGPSGGRGLWEAVQTIIVALILAVVIRSFVLESFVVNGFSMEPNLLTGEHVLVDKFLLHLTGPQDGEIVVLKPPIQGNTSVFIKRVMATAGQTVQMKDGYVYVDGKKRAEPYLRYRGDANFGPVTVPTGSVFVLGDNRPESEDSRYFGTVKDSAIDGQAFFAFWPLSRVGLLP